MTQLKSASQGILREQEGMIADLYSHLNEVSLLHARNEEALH